MNIKRYPANRTTLGAAGQGLQPVALRVKHKNKEHSSHACGGVKSQASSLYQVPKSYPASALLVSAATRESAFPFSRITESRRLRYPEDP